MSKSLLVVVAAGLAWAGPALASGRSDGLARIRKATRVFGYIENAPDRGIPRDLLEKARCVAIVPGELKAAFMVGGSYGEGLATCRTPNGWSAPVFLTLGGGSFGFQIGGSSTDVVMLFMNDEALQKLLDDKFKLGADASVAVGPLGRHVAASTDIKMDAEILAYSHSKGVFAGISLDGAVVHSDRHEDSAMYGRDATRQEILDGAVPVPRSARSLVDEISKYSARG